MIVTRGMAKNVIIINFASGIVWLNSLLHCLVGNLICAAKGTPGDNEQGSVVYFCQEIEPSLYHIRRSPLNGPHGGREPSL